MPRPRAGHTTTNHIPAGRLAATLVEIRCPRTEARPASRTEPFTTRPPELAYTDTTVALPVTRNRNWRGTSVGGWWRFRSL